jgi:hypothetical protein
VERYDDHGAFAERIGGEALAGAGSDIAAAIEPVTGAFETLWPAVERGAGTDEKLANAQVLVAAAARLLGTLIDASPATVDDFIRKEAGHDAG